MNKVMKKSSKAHTAIMAAKRARDIIDGKPMLAISEVEKPISVATLEIAEDFISYKRDGE